MIYVFNHNMGLVSNYIVQSYLSSLSINKTEFLYLILVTCTQLRPSLFFKKVPKTMYGKGNKSKSCTGEYPNFALQCQFHSENFPFAPF